MPSIDSEVKTARMSAETWRIVSEEMERDNVTFSGWVKAKASEGVPRYKGEHTLEQEVVPQNGESETDSKVYPKTKADEMIEEDARAFGLEVEEFKLKLIEAVDNGKLMYENGGFTGVGEVNTSRFMERCAELGMNPQDTINKITQRLG